MKTMLVVAAALPLAGCAIGYSKAMSTDMRNLTGEPIRTIIDRLGYPARETTIAGDKVYVWDDNGCTLKVGVDSSDHVVHADYDGDHSDCKPYRKALEGT
jgi:hypothetical protein